MNRHASLPPEINPRGGVARYRVSLYGEDMNTEKFEEMIRPALEAYADETDRHWLTSGQAGPDCTCKCGWAPKAGVKRPRVSLGMHLKAADRAADTAYAERSAEIIKATR